MVRFLRESQQDSNVLQDLSSDVLFSNAVAALLGHAVRAGDSLLLREVHQRALTDKLTLTTASCEVLLRGYSALVDSRAAKLLGEMIENGFERSESAPIAVVFFFAQSLVTSSWLILPFPMCVRCTERSQAKYIDMQLFGERCSCKARSARCMETR